MYVKYECCKTKIKGIDRFYFCIVINFVRGNRSTVQKCFIDYSKYNTQNADAHTLYTAAVSTPETLRQKGIEVPENLAIVSGKCENDSFEFLFQQELTGLLVRAEMHIKDEIWYVDIENGRIHAAVYADHSWSGFVGCYPNENTTHRSFHDVIEELQRESRN